MPNNMNLKMEVEHRRRKDAREHWQKLPELCARSNK
jgi:hypothetical protein